MRQISGGLVPCGSDSVCQAKEARRREAASVLNSSTRVTCSARSWHPVACGRTHDFLHRRRQFRRSDTYQSGHLSRVRVDVLIIETTRGDHPLPEGFTRRAEETRFAQALDRAFARGGCVLIPVFALGKTQEVLAMLYKFKREQLLDDVPILHRRVELEDDRDLRSPRQHQSAHASSPAIAPGSCAFHLEQQKHSRFSCATRTDLRSFQRHDDAKDALKHLRAPARGKSTTLDLLCRLRRS